MDKLKQVAALHLASWLCWPYVPLEVE